MEKFNVWDSKALTDLYGVVSQLENTIVSIGVENNISDLSSMPPSLVPTVVLYQLSIAYKLLYDKLLENNLLNTGNSKQLSNSLH